MTEPGERRPAGAEAWTARQVVPEPWSKLRATVVAAGAGVLAAVAWAMLRSVFDITIGSLVVAALGGWAVGASLRRGGASSGLAVLLSVAAWMVALLLAWLVAMAVLPESTRSLLDRLVATPFLDWLLPQLGIVEIGTLVVWVGAALWSVRRPRRDAG